MSTTRRLTLLTVCLTTLALASTSLPAPAFARSAQAHRLPLTLTTQVAAQDKNCPNSEFTCVKLKVPLDHFGPSPYTKEMVEVVFAVLPARNKAARKGMFVTAVGGPGASGLQNADSYAATYDDSIREVFDLV